MSPTEMKNFKKQAEIGLFFVVLGLFGFGLRKGGIGVV